MEQTIPNQIADQLFASDTVTIARLIRRYCLRRGWRMDELALRAGVSRTTLYQLLRGAIRKPRHSTLYKIAAALQLPLTYLQQDHNDEQTSHFCEARDQVVSERLQQKRTIDRAANAMVDVVEAEHPEYFADWQEQHWDELYSTFGVGGSLTYEGVLEQARCINRNRETLRKLQLVLETHLSDLAEQVVSSLYEMVAFDSESNEDFAAKLESVLHDLLAEVQSPDRGNYFQGNNS